MSLLEAKIEEGKNNCFFSKQIFYLFLRKIITRIMNKSICKSYNNII